MNESYLNSMSNTVFSVKPSKAIRLLLMVLFVSSFASAAPRTASVTGNWNDTATWAGNSIPGSGDTVTVNSGITVTVIANAEAASVSIIGTGKLTVKNNITLTVFGNVDVASGAQFNAGTKNSERATILVDGNFTNQGTANFWKSTVVIKGDFATSGTILHQDGDIIVGGNINATITGGGNGYVYPVNPSATVSVTGTSNAKPAGTPPTDSALVALMNSVIYGGACSPVITLNTINASPACKSNNQTTVTIKSTSTSMLPAGTYTVTYDFYNNNLTTSMNVSSAGTGVFIANTSVISVGSSANLRITKIASSSCYSDINSNNTSNAIFMYPSNGKPIISDGSSQCNGTGIARWSPISNQTVDGYYLDVALDSNFTIFFSDYNDKYVGNSKVGSHTLSGLQLGGTYYYRVRSKNYCGTSPNSDTKIINMNGDGSSTPGTITGGATSICVGNTTTFIKDPKSWPSTGTWSVFNQTGSASITQSGVVTGVSPGTVLVVFTTFNGSCGTSKSITLTITGGTMSVASSTPTLCYNTAINPLITHTTTGFTGISNNGVSGVNGLPAGVSASFSSNVVTISGIPTVSGTFNYTIPLIGGSCSGTGSATGTITVNPSPSTPTVTPTQPTCTVATGAIKVNTPAPAAGISYTVTGTSSATTTVTNRTGIFSGLSAGTYNVTTTNPCGTSTATSVTLSATNTWTTSWSNGTPDSTQKLVFAGNYPPANDPDVDISGCSCMVTGSKTVTIKSGRTLTITNEVTVEGNGSLIFENNASLVQINNTAVNKGDIEYQRSTSTPVLITDYVYWSSPVLGLRLEELSKETANGTFYSFDTSTENWNQAYDETLMDIGKGYIVRRPDFSSGIPVKTEKYTANFVGEPNNGTITIPGGYNGAAEGTSNLLGNPYPSAIDAVEFLKENKDVLDGTLYFWTHNTALNLEGNISNPGPGWAYTYSLDDYASYNITGGVATSAKSDPNHNVEGVDLGKKPTGKIAAGQGFFATSKAVGDVKFTNEMRVAGTTKLDGTGVNQQFFKTKNPNAKTANTTEKNRVWLNLTNTEGAFKQTLIGYVTDATNDYENLFDGQSFDGNEYVDFYSVYQDKNLVIQGRALPFDENDEVPLGYRTTINGDFTINIDQVDGSLTNQAIFIEDKLTNTTFDLKTGNYTFNTVAGTFNDRFVLKYTNKTLGIDAVEKEDGILVFYSNNYNTLIVHNESVDSIVNSVSLFNMAGQDIGVWDVRDSEQTNIQIPIKKISSGIYIVKANTTKGESSKKIIVNIQ